MNREKRFSISKQCSGLQLHSNERLQTCRNCSEISPPWQFQESQQCNGTLYLFVLFIHSFNDINFEGQLCFTWGWYSGNSCIFPTRCNSPHTQTTVYTTVWTTK